MKSVWGLVVLVIFAVGLNSCFEAPSYPSVPEITFKSVEFKKVVSVPIDTLADTLVLKITFKDGDGDLGLDSDGDDQLKYADHFYFKVNDKGRYVTTDPNALLNTPSIIRYKTKRTNHNYDTLPPFTTPYDCTNWEVLTKPDPKDPKLLVVADTIYFQINPNHNNIFIDFMVKNGNNWEEFDFRKEFCTTYDGRFPILSKNLSKSAPLEGEIRYAMAGLGFLTVFSTKTLKLRVTIQDRALNKSNTVESGDFVLK